MDIDIKNFKISKLEHSNFIKPFRLNFELNGEMRAWDCVKVHDSVSILLYHSEKKAFLLVKQFRPSVWFYQDENLINCDEKGFTYELCAGILDKGISEEQTAIEEIYEETGYELKNLEFITSFYSALGFGANRQILFYGEIDESMKKGAGGGVDGENIELYFLPLDEAKKFMYDEKIVRASGLVAAFLWFFQNKGEI
ncbi:NUDIX hydrolase [Campylobacter sp. VBCF_06 NA8]|uniref:NUDIX domain-containing protein n=1 Tax=unclassified Campylobacter TaxID=2593542 RepID=UPI0022E9D371|nr:MULTISPECIES: NUDIX hydrolase [unclassified Campylobacter]MDA3046319.1 NUDIX hydrolase [Campylobacter sp. VBCF_06 NA8]MDA3077815.1 NUDIX hydrolase [Campylobacter sp. JMF_06 NA1]